MEIAPVKNHPSNLESLLWMAVHVIVVHGAQHLASRADITPKTRRMLSMSAIQPPK